ncbi:hypothetical protein [Succinimonas sp.]|uniref:hypothetical protein n=1 Tax=Succinimonas sp. TaxID=1936151 RepID=UPI00386A63DE
MNQKTTSNLKTAQALSAVLPEAMTGDSAAADQLHQIFNSLPVYSWQTIKDVPFKDGIYIVFEKGETYKGLPRIVRVGTHTSPGRLKQRLRSHFLSEHHNSSIFRKNIGKVLLNQDHDSYLAIWTLDTSKAKNAGKADKSKEAEIEHRVSAYMREAFTFCVFPVANKEERLRLEAAIIAALHQADDFKASPAWLGRDSPEEIIRECGMWLKQGLTANPLTRDEMERLAELTASSKGQGDS